jgi:hypothetical protein
MRVLLLSTQFEIFRSDQLGPIQRLTVKMQANARVALCVTCLLLLPDFNFNFNV